MMTVIGLHIHFKAYLKFCEVYLPKFQEIMYGEQIRARASGSITFCLDLCCSTYHTFLFYDNFACWNESNASSGLDRQHVLSLWHKTWNLVEAQQGRFGWIKAPHKHTLSFLKTVLFLLDIKTVYTLRYLPLGKSTIFLLNPLFPKNLPEFDGLLIWSTLTWLWSEELRFPLGIWLKSFLW